MVLTPPLSQALLERCIKCGTHTSVPIVTIGLPLTVFAVLQLVKDRRTDIIGLAKGSTTHYTASDTKTQYF